MQKIEQKLMLRKQFVLISFLFTFIFQVFSLDTYIRINLLGYTPTSIKKAVLLSESKLNLKSFALFDALTDQKIAEFNSFQLFGTFEQFSSVYILDFSNFHNEGAFYIKADNCFSPTVIIDKNAYRGGADYLLNYMRQQRCGYNPTLNAYCHQSDGTVVPQQQLVTNIPATKKTKTVPLPLSSISIDVLGGWHDASNNIKYGSTSATAIFQMLYAYRMNPAAFADTFDANGLPFSNKIPDILDEAKWGLDWLLKMNPKNDVIYYQVGDDRDLKQFKLPIDDKTDYGWGEGGERPVYKATGKPEGLKEVKNRTTGVASIAGKYAAAFALGSDMLRKFYPSFADSLEKKAFKAYEYGKALPGVCQSAPYNTPIFYEEDNWADDMQLAATQLYQLSFDAKYQSEAAMFGRKEPIIPWLFADTVNHYQWYPFTNYGHFVLANSEKPEFKNEYLQNIKFGLKRAELRKNDNPFGVGVPMVMCSNNYVTALATQCNLYRRYSGDSTYLGMETALTDWLFGCNPWGTSMIVGLPISGKTPKNIYSAFSYEKGIAQNGGLVNGPIRRSIFENQINLKLSKEDKNSRFQTKWAVYHDDYADYSTNEPTIDGTASLVYLLGAKQFEENKLAENNKFVDGGIVRTNPDKKTICLVFTGHEYADGARKIMKALTKNNVKASFFLTGDFLRKRKFNSIIKKIKKEGHYIGAHSDQHLQYCQFENNKSLLIDKTLFTNDLKENYTELQKFGITKADAPFFIPPYELYNDSISLWCKNLGLCLVNFTPGTRSNADFSIPEMREKYFSSEEIYSQIMATEAKETLNGHILLFHIGTDPRRTDKFYNRLNSLISELKNKGYCFTDLNDALGYKKPANESVGNKKRKHL